MLLILSFRNKAILDYLLTSGFTESYNILKSETQNEDFTSDPKQKYAGLLEKKWTSVIRLQKKAKEKKKKRESMLLTVIIDYGTGAKISTNAGRNQ